MAGLRHLGQGPDRVGQSRRAGRLRHVGAVPGGAVDRYGRRPGAPQAAAGGDESRDGGADAGASRTGLAGPDLDPLHRAGDLRRAHRGGRRGRVRAGRRRRRQGSPRRLQRTADDRHRGHETGLAPGGRRALRAVRRSRRGAARRGHLRPRGRDLHTDPGTGGRAGAPRRRALAAGHDRGRPLPARLPHAASAGPRGFGDDAGRRAQRLDDLRGRRPAAGPLPGYAGLLYSVQGSAPSPSAFCRVR